MGLNTFARVVYRCITFGCRFFRKNYAFIAPKEVDELVENLIHRIRNSTFKPDIIVCIMTGGHYPARKIADRLNLPLGKITISYYSLKLFGVNFVYFPWVVILFRYLGWMTAPRCTKGLDVEITGKRVLLLDDDIEQGKTLELAVQLLEKERPLDIKTIILNPNEKKESVDFYPSNLYELSSTVQEKRILYGDRLRFKWPWEPISPYYQAFRDNVLVRLNALSVSADGFNHWRGEAASFTHAEH